MNYSLTAYTHFELSALAEAIENQIKDHERYIKAVDHNQDLSNLLSVEIAMRKKKLTALYDQRVHVKTAFDIVKRLEITVSN